MNVEVVVLLAIVAVSVASMGVYAQSAAGRRRGRDASGRGGSFVLGYFARDWFYWALQPLRDVAFATGASPFVFNVAGLVFAFAAGIAIATGRLPLGGALVLASGVADVLDGDVARRRGVVSPSGAFIDSTFDRFAEVFVFVGLAWFFDARVPDLLVVVGLAGSLLVSYTRARGESVGVVCKAGILQRAERMILLALGSILDPSVSAAAGHPIGWLLVWVLWAIAVGTIATAVFRTVWIVRRLRGPDAD